MAELNSLKSKRTVLKANLTKFRTTFNDIKTIAVVDEDNLLIFESKLAKAEGLLDDFFEIQLKIEEANSEFVVDTKERDDFENNYHNTIPLAKGFLQKQRSTKIPVSTGNPSSTNPEQIAAAKLPSIVLPKFNGLYENWLAFHDGFDSLVHKNRALDDVNKLHFLKSCLIGDAAQNVITIETTAANYEVAWGLLKARYANKRVLINKHIGAIYEIQGITKESAMGLRQIVEAVHKNIRSLQSLGQNYDQCDLWLIYVLSGKLDWITRRDWEEKCGNEIPTLERFLEFINARCVTLENLNSNAGLNCKFTRANSSHYSQNLVQNAATKTINCPFCKEIHPIYNCSKFLEKSVQERTKIVGRLKLCYKCLKSNHSVAQCKSNNCRYCQRTHNSLLHIINPRSDNNNTEGWGPNNAIQSAAQVNTGIAARGGSSQVLGIVGTTHEVLLSTAMVRLVTKWGESIEARVLIDSGSQSHFISSALCDKLGATQTFNQIKLHGINGASSEVSYTTKVRIMSCVNNYECSVTCLVVPKVTGKLPSVTFASDIIKIPHRFTLADPQFYVSRDIDIILGADKFYELICEGQYVLGKNMPTLQNTLLGYVLGGRLSGKAGKAAKAYHCIIHSNNTSDIACSLANLWEDEVMVDKKFLSDEESRCESQFNATVQRASTGSFVVTIPFKESLTKLGNSRSMAINRFFNLESKLNKNTNLNLEYTKFMRKYISLGHKRSRGSKLIKAYVCLFVCLAVKAFHLELVSELTTECFLAALRRFIARRGKPSQIHSDNATNFVGARNEFKKFLRLNSEKLSNELHEKGVEWHFIPPKSPHFGGIWEAGVKSVKTHLIRILGSAHLDFEIFYTVLAQIEAVLNSRPLCPLSHDPNDMSALTPAHFLIGRTLTAAPDLDMTDVPINRLSRFQRAQQLQQHFWTRWSREYVNTLQQRTKVRAPAIKNTLKVGTMVIVQEDHLPTLSWPLGRIVDVFPGEDGVVRVVNVRTRKGIFKRAVRKLSILPIEQE